MVQMYRQCLCIEAAWLFESGIISEAGYRQAAHRGDIRVLRRGCRGVSALVDFESLPPRIKQSIREQIGNPYDHMETNILQAELQPIPAAADFYDQFTIDAAGRHLPAATARQYYAEACILTAIGSVIARLSGRARACGHRQTGVWDEMAAAIKAIDVVRWPHHLPSNPRSLERKFRAFRADGYAALIHGGFKNANAAKVTADADLTELLDLTSDPRNLPDTTVARIFNARHETAPITPGVVARFRQAHEQEIYARRHGGSEFRANRLMTVKRSAPSAPLYLWVLDGWDAELLYQKTATDKAGHNVTTYFNRVKLEVILDACTCYPIGFAIADTESPALVKAALRDALDHVRTLFGSRFRPAQIQMDHAGYKSLADLYAATAVHVTPAAVRNAKAKVIEPWFRRFNDAYCHLQPNWSGYGLTADKATPHRPGPLLHGPRHRPRLPLRKVRRQKTRNHHHTNPHQRTRRRPARPRHHHHRRAARLRRAARPTARGKPLRPQSRGNRQPTRRPPPAQPLGTFFRRGGKKQVAPQLLDYSLNNLYYEDGQAPADPDTPDLAPTIGISDEAIAAMMAKIYRDQFGISDILTSDILRETEGVFSKAIDRGVPRWTSHRTAFEQQLKQSTDVFSVFKVHTQAEEIARQILDEQGNRRSFHDWAIKVQPYLNHQNKNWLRTEYSTAIRRAHDEADWQRFEEDKDIYECLEWVQTTASRPAPDHKCYWGTVLPVDDPFWSEHRPGDRWNCQCSLRQTKRRPNTPNTPRPNPTPTTRTTPSTRPATTNPNDPQPGLNTKPGSREIFSDDHAYYPDDCRICPFAKEAGRLRLALTNLTGSKRRTLAPNCHQCKFREKCMERRSAKPEAAKTAAVAKDVAAKGYSAEPPATVADISPIAQEELEKRGVTLSSDDVFLTAS